MTQPSPRVIGLTGGIASGKSTVARMLTDLGARVVDADQLAREVVAPGTRGLAEIVDRFGPDILLASGELDRAKLGAIVFNDVEARRDLEAITHPKIAAASREAIARYAAQGATIVVYEAPLVVENKLYTWMAALIVVSVPLAVQKQRLLERDGIDEAAADARIAAQMSLEDKCRVATHIVDNSGTVEATRAQVEAIWKELQ